VTSSTVARRGDLSVN
jgi:transposase